MKISALKNTIISGLRTYPIYIAFIKASDVLKYAIVPNFNKSDNDKSIATNLQKTPVEKWQRPLDDRPGGKRDKIIQTFNNTGEFMPNPVLLSENPYVENKITANPKVINGQTSELWELNIPEAEKVIWIIDGQHRINGLGHKDCKQNENLVPVVLLINDNTNSNSNYSPVDFAKIFAQVTTTATTLKDLHKEWMQYSFDMDKYDKLKHRKSMKTVIEMCANSDFKNSGSNIPNPFHDNIVFNDDKISNNTKLNCIVLSELIFSNYYDLDCEHSHLQPFELSEILENAYYTLKGVVVNPKDSVFFGSNDKIHVIMIKSFLKGILAYALKFCNPIDPKTIPNSKDWKKLYLKLNFDKTNWDWASASSSGEGWYKKSENLASVVFIETFKAKKIPDNCLNLEQYIVLGNNKFIELEYVTPSGTKNKIINMSKTIINEKGMSNLKIIAKSFNNENISIIDKNSPPAYPEHYKMDYSRRQIHGKGIDLPQNRPITTKRLRPYNSTNKFSLVVTTTLYGGMLDTCQIDFNI